MANEINENIFLVNAPAGSGKTTEIRKNGRHTFERISGRQHIVYYIYQQSGG